LKEEEAGGTEQEVEARTMTSVAQWLRDPPFYVVAWWVFAVILVAWMIWYDLHGGHRKPR
jgi:hypothetical protein